MFTVKLLKTARAIAQLYEHPWGGVPDEILKECVALKSTNPIVCWTGGLPTGASNCRIGHRSINVVFRDYDYMIEDHHTTDHKEPALIKWQINENKKGIAWSVNVEMINKHPSCSAHYENGFLVTNEVNFFYMKVLRDEFFAKMMEVK